MKILLMWLWAYLSWMGLFPGIISQGIKKQTVYKKQIALGTVANGAGGQILRRENSVWTLAKATYESTEIVSHQQATGTRHGLQSVTGKITGLLSPGTYKDFMAAAMRAAFVAGINSTALINVTAATTTGAQGTFTRAAGSYLTDGFKVGDVIRWTGWTTGGVNNNTKNMMIIALTATVMTVQTLDGSAVAAKASGDSVTATVVGKKAKAPLTAHTDDIFTFEEWYSDITQDEQFVDCKLNTMGLDLPASGNTKVTFDFVGLDRNLFTAQQLTTPASETTSGICTAVTGVLMINGTPVANVTGLKITVAENATADGPVVGSNNSPDISRGKIKVSGDFTAYFQDASLTTLFQADTVTSLAVAVCADTTAAADFVAFTLGRILIGSDTPDDGEKGIVRSYSFVAEINNAGGVALAWDQTIMTVQDSLA